MNESKSKMMVFNRTDNYHFATRVHSNNTLMETISETWLLGTIISSDLTWRSNTQQLRDRSDIMSYFFGCFWQGGILFFLRGSGVTIVENFARNSVIFDIYSIDSSVVHLAQWLMIIVNPRHCAWPNWHTFWISSHVKRHEHTSYL